MHLLPDTILQNGKYKISRVLGQGGFGITYEAEQLGLHRRVAIKEFFIKDFCEREDSNSHVTLGTSGSKEIVEKFRTKFIREAQMIASLDHPNIVKIYDVFEENGTAYYVMEYLEGGSLEDLIKRAGALSEEKALNYICQVGDALTYLHSHNCLHFDIKPSNVLLNRVGKAVLIDFGIAKHYDQTGSQTSSTPVGISKGYAPLEQYQQMEISFFTPATDIYALGATYLFLLTGQTPPSASEVNEDGLPEFPQSISINTRNAIIKAMAPRRKDRPQDVNNFVSLLNEKNVVDNEGGDETIIAVSKPKSIIVTESKPRVTDNGFRNNNDIISPQKHNNIIKPLLIALLFVSVAILIVVIINSTRKDEPYVTQKETVNTERHFYYSGSLSKGQKKLEIEMNLTFYHSNGGTRDVSGTYHYLNKPKDAILHVYGKNVEYGGGAGHLVLFCRESPERFDLDISSNNNASGTWRSYKSQSEVETGGSNYKNQYYVKLTAQ